ncbi:Hypothetical predicted protein [Mytilus galloprovincialis]|uniref:Voltage-gated hydrogen channel 1 n=1 Tax=Mytilus galloprovincialis TaxID=29158 RepID=A0A8B6GVT8_MYTGA|nr:Hypothetical predicted protein [Mytilus galloprovincialis]
MFPNFGASLNGHTPDGGGNKPKYGKRRESAIRTLVAETLVLAKTHGYVEKIENELEEELQQDSLHLHEHFGKIRRRGYEFFKSKYMLLTLVILCILDCALVLGELTLDLYKVKVTLEETENFTNSTQYFLALIRHSNEQILKGKQTQEIFNMLLQATIQWNISNSDHDVINNSTNMTDINPDVRTMDSMFDIKTVIHSHKEYSIEEEIAHICHFASIAILGIVSIETILKALCAGSLFFHRRLEVFDAFVVTISFVADTVLLVAFPTYSTRDFVFILAFLLPWRVIRVVDSLVVAVKDHEHFRLKLLYGRKKKIQNTLRDTEVKVQIFKYQCNALRRLCLAEGIDEWKVDQCLKAEQKFQSTLGKRKNKMKLDSSSLCLISENETLPSSSRSSPRPSIPSLDFCGLKFMNGNSVKHNENDSIDDVQEV